MPDTFVIGTRSASALKITAQDRHGSRFAGALEKPIVVTLDDPLGHVRLSCATIWDTTATPTVSSDGHADDAHIRLRKGHLIRTLQVWTRLPKDVSLSTESSEVIPAWLRVGGDGNLWGPLSVTTAIDVARIAPNGTTTVFSDPVSTHYPPLLQSILGPDGNIWVPYTNSYGEDPSGIDRIAQDGAFTAFPFPSAGFDVSAMVQGKNDDLILGLNSSTAGQIASFAMNGTMTVLASTTETVSNLTWGSDGNLWFYLSSIPSRGSRVRIGTIAGGALKTYSLCCFNLYAGSFSFAAGPDGEFWAPYPFGTDLLVKFNTSGKITDRLKIPYTAAWWPTPLKTPNIVDYATDGDGNLYAADKGADGTEYGGSGLIRITRRGTVTEYPTYQPGSGEPTSVVFDVAANRLYLANTRYVPHKFVGGSLVVVDPRDL